LNPAFKRRRGKQGGENATSVERSREGKMGGGGGGRTKKKKIGHHGGPHPPTLVGGEKNGIEGVGGILGDG